MAAVQHCSTKVSTSALALWRTRAIAGFSTAILLAVGACGSTTPPAAPPAASAAPSPAAGQFASAPSERAVTLGTRTGDVRALVRQDAQLPGQYVVAFTPGFREDVAESGAAIARIVGTVAGSEPAAKITFFSNNPNQFYLGDGAERFCVHVTRETENGGIVAMRFGLAADAPKSPATVASKGASKG